jgi:ribosome-associated heat shock protein Hsp15
VNAAVTNNTPQFHRLAGIRDTYALTGLRGACVSPDDARPKSAQCRPMEKVRIDKWLWAARFYKTRSLSAEEVSRGRVQVNGLEAKPSREVKAGDSIAMRQGPVTRTVTVLGVSSFRGPAPVAQALYAETEESLANRARAAEQRRLAPEPALTLEHGRPTKRERRTLDEAKGHWGDRWSASVDP